MNFDIKPYLHPEDPWPQKEGLAVVRQIYDQKYTIASLLKPRSILEIGVRAGYSAAAFLAASPGASYLGIDNDSSSSGGWPGATPKAQAMLAKHFPGQCRVRVQDTQYLTQIDGLYDLVHVDGDHSQAGCLHDLRLAAKVGRWVLVDDQDHEPSVAAATLQFIEEIVQPFMFLPTVRGDCLIETGLDTTRVASHYGDVGDTLAALPALKLMGGGKLVLYSAQGRVREVYSEDKVARLRPLLDHCPYIHGVTFARESPAGAVVLDRWRERGYGRKLNIADMVCECFGLEHFDRNMPWLYVPEGNPVAPVVFCRSPRYHHCDDLWRRAMLQYPYDSRCFVGLRSEHEAFELKFGKIRHYPTETYLDLAQVIWSSEIFVVNQTSPAWVGIGLCRQGHKIMVEEFSGCANCDFERDSKVQDLRYCRCNKVCKCRLPTLS